MRIAIGILIIGLGTLLSLVGLLFRFLHWPDIFRGFYTGPGLIGAGLIWVVVAALRPPNLPATGRLRLHSLMTYWVKYVWPGLALLMWLVLARVAGSPSLPTDAAGPTLGFLAVLLLAGTALGAQLKLAYRVGDTVYLGRYQAQHPYPVEAVRHRKLLFADLYRIRTPDGKRHLLLGRLTPSWTELTG
jgi:hypothetical protein